MSTFNYAAGGFPERYLELLADEALDALSASDRGELDQHRAKLGDVSPDMDHVVASLTLAMLSPSDVKPMPRSLEARLLEAGRNFTQQASAQKPISFAREHNGGSQVGRSQSERAQASNGVESGASAVAGRIVPEVSTAVSAQGARPVSRGASPLPWLVAAAAVTIAAVGWMRPSGRVVVNAPDARPVAALVETSPDVVKATFGDWDKPEVAGVKGQVAWSDAKQTGVMEFTNLPALDPTKECYQLWIIDSRGMEQRISGGCFNAIPGGKGVTTVVIKPGIQVVGAAAFAVTIERPEGTWVSDMKRRVVIAKKG